MLELVASAIAFGFLFNAAPGAIFAESLRRGLHGGFRPALAVQIGSLVGDLGWALIGLSGAGALLLLPVVERPLALAGAALLALLAGRSLLDAIRPMPALDPTAAAPDQASAVVTGAALSLTNPVHMAYWVAMGGTISAMDTDLDRLSAFAVFLAGFMLTSVAWCFLCAWGIAWTRRRIGSALWMGLHGGCGIGLAAFAVMILHRSLAGN